MANLLDIRRRIKSVKNTQQITKAMKMVSAAKLMREHAGKEVEILAVGRKGRDFFRRRGQLAGEYVGLTGKGRIEHAEALEVARDVLRRFSEDEGLDKVFLIFNEFRSVISQRVVVEQILPVSRAEVEAPKAVQPQTFIEYVYE